MKARLLAVRYTGGEAKKRKEPRMKEYIAFDSHKHYTLVEREDVTTGQTRQFRIAHCPGAIRTYLGTCEPGSAVAVEATANWYWIVDEIEQAGLRPRLVHPRKAKLMMGMINKTDKLDVHGLNKLQRNRTLPTVWVPPAEIRDLRELTRTRMVIAGHRTRLKNRILATLSKYGFLLTGYSDPFGKRARQRLTSYIEKLPPQTHYATRMLLKQLDFIEAQVKAFEERLQALIRVTPEMELLMSLPGIGVILSAVIAFEIGDVNRFPDAEHLASYAGTTPRVHSSGGKVRYGGLRPDVNRYLQWGFVEAANSVAVNHAHWPGRHLSQVYRRVRQRRDHSKAIGAVARHLAEAAFDVLSKKESYLDPGLKKACPERSRRGRTREA
jgi:transposase